MRAALTHVTAYVFPDSKTEGHRVWIVKWFIKVTCKCQKLFAMAYSFVYEKSLGPECSCINTYYWKIDEISITQSSKCVGRDWELLMGDSFVALWVKLFDFQAQALWNFTILVDMFVLYEKFARIRSNKFVICSH